jgi:hypothetical protein
MDANRDTPRSRPDFSATALRPFRVPKDVLVYSRDEFEKWEDSLNHVVAHAVREGKLLYERS